MPTYSISTILFIILQSVSLTLLLYLIVIVLKSKPYFTKWTLFQISTAAFGNGFINLPVIITHGDELVEHAFDTPLCIIQQKVSVFFVYPLQIFSCTLAFYLWYALYRRNLEIEKKTIKRISYATWIFTIVFNGILIGSSSRSEHWGVLPSSLGCRNSKNAVSIYGYIITTSILGFILSILTFHSIIILWRRQMNFSNFQNRRTAIRLGESVRLCVWCLTLIILTILPLIPRVIQKDSPIYNYINLSKIASFSSALDGTFLFLIFGTDRKAAVFLPCYYIPPEKAQAPQFPDEYIETCDLNDQLSQMSQAHLRQNSSNSNNWNYIDSFSTLNDDSIGSRYEKERVQEYI